MGGEGRGVITEREAPSYMQVTVQPNVLTYYSLPSALLVKMNSKLKRRQGVQSEVDVKAYSSTYA